MRVLELFSGIGGMHFALKEASIRDMFVVSAIDLSEVPNKVYRHNFPHTTHMNKNICGLTAQFINDLGVDVILMSPPCQPFTRQGNRKDTDDPRTQPLINIINILEQLSTLKYILLENVKGFETSQARARLVQVLKSMGFQYQEFLLSPTQLGIPNSRLRYYLLARSPSVSRFTFCTKEEIRTDLENGLSNFQGKDNVPKVIQDYLDPKGSDNANLLLSDSLLLKRAEVLDIVNSESVRSCCFTKAYGRYVEGTGSVLQQFGNLDDVYARSRHPGLDEERRLEVLKELGLRFFSPSEISRLMGFGDALKFPEDMTLIQKFRCLGNSINVKVVACMLRVLFHG